MALDDVTQGEPGPADADPDERLPLRHLTDARTMRALSHPVRIALLEQLTIGGAMTATEVGERIGESPTTCSFHLRQLAKYGWVEEAGGGKGRARPWRMASIGFRTSSTHDDPDTDIAASALLRLFRERQLARYETWMGTRGSYPRVWQDAVSDSEYIFYLTPDELRELNDTLHATIVSRLDEKRLTDPSQRPPGSLPIEVLTFGYPIEPPSAATDGTPSGEDPGRRDRRPSSE
ncbi:MAG TPA: helix-turn-helix domain-containing protein [Streptosporangiaceae bacterium]|jgi:DNA-binding transcriptional ArsR family regulator